MKFQHEELIDGLDAAQAACVASAAPLKVAVAGPGSGKTRLLAAAVAAEPDPRAACVVTYTAAAARELRARLAAAGVEAGWCGTLHAFCLRTARERHALAGLPARLSVARDAQRESVMRSVLEDTGLGRKMTLSRALKWSESAVGAGALLAGRLPPEALAAAEFHSRMLGCGLLDFQAVLDCGLAAAKAAAAAGEWPYRLLAWDEFQDSSPQDAAVMAAMPFGRKLAVGDPDQAVYGFRGGDPSAMLRLAAGGSGWEAHKLETNYRSCPEVCALGERVAAGQSRRLAKSCRPAPGAAPGEVREAACGSPQAEAAEVAAWLAGRDPSSCAVLCRTNWHAEQVAAALAAAGARVAERRSEALPEDWRAAEALLCALDNPWSDAAVAAHRECQVGAQRADAEARAARAAMVSLNESLGGRYSAGPWRREALKFGLSAGSVQRVLAAADALGDCTASEALLHLRSGEPPPASPGVAVSTAHAAKGREWESVAVCGCEEGLFPQSKRDSDADEERRLFFVACTRASRRLLLCWSRSRPQWRGRGSPPGPAEPRERSRFLSAL